MRKPGVVIHDRLRGISTAVLLLCLSSESGLAVSPAENHANVIRNFVIYESPGRYCAWPSLTRTSEGDLIVLFTRSEEHLGPDGAIMLSRSTNNGETWLSPVEVYNSPIDDRESGLTTLRDGRILTHIWSTFHTKETYALLHPKSYQADVLARWTRYVERSEYRSAKKVQGAWTVISNDGGRTWSGLLPGHDSIHGGIETSRGGLLVSSYRTSRGSITVHSADSVSGLWRQVASIDSPLTDSVAFGEPHLLQLASGRVIMMIRATAIPFNDQDPKCVLWETYSDDEGKTWVKPYATPLWGFPPHLALTSDGRVLCTYGYRRPPYGQRACVSNDGIQWSLRDETILRDDAPNGDLGYPASIELEPGVVLTVYYQPNVAPGTEQRMTPPDPGRTKPGILGTLWRLPMRH